MTWPKSRLAMVPCVIRTRRLVRSRCCHHSGSVGWPAGGGQRADVLHLRVGVRVLEALDPRVQIEIGQCGHGFEDGAWKRGTTKAGEGSVDGLLRGLKYEALAESQLCIALLRSLAGAHRNVLPAGDIDDGDAEVRDGRALVARADEHG